MTHRTVVDYVIGKQADPRQMMQSLAYYYGVGSDVRDLLDEKGTTAPSLHTGGLGALLTAQRRLTGDTIQAVHDRCKVARSQLGYYENSKPKNPGVRTLQALAYGYNLPFILVLVAAIQDASPNIDN